LLATVAIGAVLASSAFATATTTAANWYTGSTGTLLSGSATLTASASGATKFATSISGTAVEFQASSVSCVGCSISNSPGAHGTGKLRFSGLTLLHPSSPPCGVTDPIETAALTIEADWMEGTSALVKFVPTSGSTLFSFTITGSPCPAGTFPVKGVLFGKTTAATGTQAASQTIQFTPAINSAAGGSLAVGGFASELTGTDVLSIGGTPFGVH
jgi:hypothetical protein